VSEPLAAAASVQLRADPRAPGVARHFIAATCEASGVDPDTCATAALLVSELVTNAVIHARTEVLMHLLPAAQRLRVEVTDGDPAGDVEVQPHDPAASGGRGLQLLDALADDWGTQSTPRARLSDSSWQSRPVAIRLRARPVFGTLHPVQLNTGLAETFIWTYADVVQTLPISAVKSRLNEYVDAVSVTHEQVTITKNGSPAAVLIGSDEWESIQETLFWLSQPGIRDTIAEADADTAAGRTHGEDAIRAEFGVPKRDS
jgi:antitoxin YefM